MGRKSVVRYFGVPNVVLRSNIQHMAIYSKKSDKDRREKNNNNNLINNKINIYQK